MLTVPRPNVERKIIITEVISYNIQMVENMQSNSKYLWIF